MMLLSGSNPDLQSKTSVGRQTSRLIRAQQVSSSEDKGSVLKRHMDKEDCIILAARQSRYLKCHLRDMNHGLSCLLAISSLIEDKT